MILPHNVCTYTIVVDYGQNMELSVLNKELPGCVYLYSPLCVYNLGMVNQAHDDSNGQFVDHMHAHVYREGVKKKGAKNICSLIRSRVFIIKVLTIKSSIILRLINCL